MNGDRPQHKHADTVPLRGFWSLIATQFQVAFNDNALRFLVTFMGLHLWQRDHEAFVPIVGALFSAPFLIFSMAGGYLADRFSKRTVTISIKVFEILVMSLALISLTYQNVPLALTCVFLMGTHSAFYGPSKYGMLPELLPERKLSWGNGIIEMGTFTAIIIGSQTGAWLYSAYRDQPSRPGIILVALSILGLFISFGITKVPAADPTRKYRINFLGDLYRQIKTIHLDRVLWLAVVGNIYFSFLGMLIQQNIVLYGTETLAVGEVRTGILLAALALGIGLGSVAAGYLSGGKIEYGLIPLGAMGMTVSCIALSHRGALAWEFILYPGILHAMGLSAVSMYYAHGLVFMATLGFSGGFFIVPIAAIIQHRPSRANKGGVLGTANLLSFVGIFLATGVYYAIVSVLHLKPPSIFLIGAAITVAGTTYITWLMPDSLLRLVLWMLTHTIYRIRVVGRENIPEKGGALFVCNHMSIVDAILLGASTDRFIRFVMFKEIYDRWYIKPFVKTMHVIPIASNLGPREMIHSLREASATIESGEIVGIFPEGQMSRIGQLLPFRRGFQRIIKGIDAPIVPVNIDGIWGSIFSFKGGRYLWKVPKRIPYPITISFGSPMPPTATPAEVRLAVQDLQVDAFSHHRERMKPLGRAILKTSRRHPFRFAMADARSGRLNFGAALTKSVFLARRLRKVWDDRTMVGILLPPSVPGALVNQAALLQGKTPVNLNYTVSASTLASCAQQCGIEVVITSKAFLERADVQVPGRAVYLEDIAANPKWTEKACAFLIAWLLPARLLERAVGKGKTVSLDDLATVIFSSGSTGEPKGVMLTHYNIGSNIEQAGQVLALNPSDGILGILPFFHSFGFTVTLALPGVLGIGVVFHPTPLDHVAIGALVREHRTTIVLATPTFLQGFIRRCEPEDFGSVRLVVTGAEKLPERVALAFEEKFAIRPLEGYGSTECAPIVAVNIGSFRAPGIVQIGAKHGKIGLPLPGMSVRIVDPETYAPVPVGQSGLLLVRGPNVMKGYLGQPQKTAEVLRDGWYVTGDIVAMDEDGFLEITDRLSRFSKIGGEMVPHLKVEEILQLLAGKTEQCFAVTGVPDGKKGERLIVLHTLPDEEAKECMRKLASSDLPNLWKPRANQFFHVEQLPYLGTGKLNLRKVRDIALARDAESSNA